MIMLFFDSLMGSVWNYVLVFSQDKTFIHHVWTILHGIQSQLAFYVNLHRAVIGPSATLTGRWRPDIDLCRMLTGIIQYIIIIVTNYWHNGNSMKGTNLNSDKIFLFVFLSILTFTTRRQIGQILLLFHRKKGFDISCKLSPLGTICMKCQSLISGENKKNITKCRLLKIYPTCRALSFTLQACSIWFSQYLRAASKFSMELL